jgi:uncharacterized protein
MVTLCIGGVTVSAYAYDGVVCDDYDVLTDSQEDELNEYLYQKSQEANVNIAVVITDVVSSSTVTDYADVYEEQLFGVNSNSILYLINMNDGYDWITCSGSAIDYYPQSTIDYILNSTSGTYLMGSDMDFYGAITKFGKLVVTERGSSSGGSFNLGISIGALFVSILISLVVCLIIASKYKFHATTDARVYAQYRNGGEIVFTQRKDMFMRTYTRKTPKNQGGGGGGSHTHTSSGGGTHSGGGFHR